MNAKEAEKLLFKAGFYFDRQKGNHKIYKKNNIRIVIPFHSEKELHPKIVIEIKQLLESG